MIIWKIQCVMKGSSNYVKMKSNNENNNEIIIIIIIIIIY